MNEPTDFQICDLYNRLLFVTKYVDVITLRKCIAKLGYDHHDSFEAMISGLTDKQLQIVFDSYDEARQPTHFKLPKPYFYNILPPRTGYDSNSFVSVYKRGRIGNALSEEQILCSPIVSFNYRADVSLVFNIFLSGFIELDSNGKVRAGVDHWSRSGNLMSEKINELTFILSIGLMKRSGWTMNNGNKRINVALFSQNLEDTPPGKAEIIFDEPISLDYVEILVCPDKEVKKFSKIIAESNYKHIQVVSRSNFSKQKYLRSVKKVRRLYYDA